MATDNSFVLFRLQAALLLEAFNKDRASLPQPVPVQPPASALPPPDPRTQEMINEKLKKAEDLGKGNNATLYVVSFYGRSLSSH